MRRRTHHARCTIGIGRHPVGPAFNEGLEDQKELLGKHWTNSVVHRLPRCCADSVSRLFRACRETVSSAPPGPAHRHISVMGLKPVDQTLALTGLLVPEGVISNQPIKRPGELPVSRS